MYRCMHTLTHPHAVLLSTQPTGGKGFGDPVTFDNNYYTSLLAKPWLDPTLGDMANHIGLPSDHVLPEDPECEAVIKEYATDERAFFSDFAAAYARLATLGANWA